MTEVNSLKRKYADIPTVTIVVGNEEKNFAIHDEKLFAASPVLKDLFDQIDKKGSARLLNLVDHDADLFEIFVDWLYSGVLNLPKFGPNQREKGTVMYAVRLYGMAEKFQALRLKNDVCKYLFVLVTKANFEAPPRCAIVQAYHHTPNKSMIRRLLVDWFVYNTKSDWFQATSNQSWLVSLPRLAMDLAVGFSQGGSSEPQDGPFAKGNTNHYAEVAVRMNQQTTTEAKPNGNMNKAPGPVIYEID